MDKLTSGTCCSFRRRFFCIQILDRSCAVALVLKERNMLYLRNRKHFVFLSSKIRVEMSCDSIEL